MTPPRPLKARYAHELLALTPMPTLPDATAAPPGRTPGGAPCRAAMTGRRRVVAAR